MSRHWLPSMGASGSLFRDIWRQLKKFMLIDWSIEEPEEDIVVAATGLILSRASQVAIKKIQKSRRWWRCSWVRSCLQMRYKHGVYVALLPDFAACYRNFARFCAWSWTHLRSCLNLLNQHSLWSPYEIGQTIIFLPRGFYLLSFFPRLISAAADWMSTILPHMMWP